MDDVTAHSFELLEHLAERDAEREAAGLELSPLRQERTEPLPAPDWTRFRSVSEMSQSQFSRWCDAGRPALGVLRRVNPDARHLVPSSAMDEATSAAWNEWLRQALSASNHEMASIIGGVIAELRQKDRSEVAELRSAIDGLKLSLAQLRAQRAHKDPLPRRPGIRRHASVAKH